MLAATHDVRGPDHYLFRVRADNGEVITMGHDARGNWASKRTGEIDRSPPAWLLSHWTSFGSGTVLLMTVDDLLDKLRASYDLRRTNSEPLAGAPGSACDRITATRQGQDPADAGRVELWLDPHSHIVRRIEMFWEDAPDSAPDRPDAPPDGPPPHEGRRLPPRDSNGAPRPRPPDLTRHAAAARTAIFDLVQTAPFAADWFDPTAHLPR